MARRSRRGNEGQTALVLLVGLLVGVAIIIQIIVTEVTRHPVAAVLVLLVVGGLGMVGGTLWWRQRSRRLAERTAALAHWQQVQAMRAREIATYHQMGAKEFEHGLAYLCERDGCSNVQVVGGAGDLGADVIAVTPQGALLVIQAKRYRLGNQVSGPDLQRFGGTCYAIHGAQVAAVITTSGFTKQATSYAQQMGIRIFGNDELAGWASRTGPPPWTV